MAYLGFAKLKSKIAAEGGAENPAAVAASIGRKKYGNKRMAEASAHGRSHPGSKSILAPKK